MSTVPYILFSVDVPLKLCWYEWELPVPLSRQLRHEGPTLPCRLGGRQVRQAGRAVVQSPNNGFRGQWSSGIYGEY